MTSQQFRSSLNGLLAEYHHARQSYKEEKIALAAGQRVYRDAEEARRILQEVAQAVQTKATRQLEAVVTRCVRTVFGDDGYDFRIKIDRKRGKTEAKLVFVRDDNELDPLSEAGGGVCDWAALSLRLACLMLQTPRPRLLLCGDEIMKNVHGQVYRERTAQLLETLSQELDIQVLLTTGFDWLRIGKVVGL